MSEITPDDLSTRLGIGDEPFILDVRDGDAYEEWHIPGSENIEIYDELKNEPEAAKDALSQIPKGEEVVTVCAAGVISKKATEYLQELGYDAKTLVDGMNGWSRVHHHAEVEVAVEGTLIQVARPGKGCLSYVLISNGEAAVFDPSQYSQVYDGVLTEHSADLVGVFDTHAHADHVSGGRQLADRHGVPYYLHPNDAEDFDVTSLADEQSVEVGGVKITVIHTPGHSPGSVTFAVEDEALLTGDTLFHESVGRVELGVEAGTENADVTENAERLYESLQRLRTREDDPLVLPAHDSGSPDPPVAERLSEVAKQNTDLERPRAEFVAALSNDLPKHPPNFQRVKRINVGAEDVADDELMELEVGPNRCAVD